jgi:hypothetical protein
LIELAELEAQAEADRKSDVKNQKGGRISRPKDNEHNEPDVMKERSAAPA